ncbi:unnamed protein product [Phytophthora fragariaefolia]|uniref:Unnamed protein product n=1 Tax=Phytophthora fragariaefolia TaxID=1490495 RepID=A0A9W6XT80_9STRA|nr:unnamed protein product [Phytophthora fragariaefolia]
MSCGGRNDFRLGQRYKDKLLATGTLHDVIPCDAQTCIDAHLGTATLSALQAIPILPTPQLATASQFSGTHRPTAGQQHTTSPMSSVLKTGLRPEIWSTEQLRPALCTYFAELA